MAVPKRKTSKARHRKRHAQWMSEVTPTMVVRCRNCGGRHQPHATCPYCGHYKGRQVHEARIGENA